MTISIDWTNKLVLSTASITDIVAFKDTLRGFEDDDVGMLYDPIIQYKRVDLGGGAYFHDVPFINGYQLKFPNPGNYTVIGNIGATIVPVAGVFVDRTKSAAFATVAGSGASGPTASEIATAVRAELASELGAIASIETKVDIATAILKNKTVTNPTTGIMTVYDADGTTPLLTAQLYETVDGSVPYRGQGAERREALV
jgi:hypothetical protein